MRLFYRSATTALIISVFLAMGAAASAAEAEPSEGAPRVEDARIALTVEMVKSRAAGIAASSALDEASQAELAELYRQTIGSLEAMAANREVAQRFESAIQSSRAEIDRLRAELEQRRQQMDSEPLELGSLSLEEAELRLQEAKAERASAEARLADIRSRVDKEKERATLIPQLASEAKGQIAKIESGRDLQLAGAEPAEITQARAWVKESRLEQLRAEILMLDQERTSQPVRLESLRAQQDLAEISFTVCPAEGCCNRGCNEPGPPRRNRAGKERGACGRDHIRRQASPGD